MTTYGYAAVSADDQTHDAQLEALRVAGCETILHDMGSGARADRPQLERLLAAIDPEDILIVPRLDQLARSTRDLLGVFRSIAERRVGFRSLGEDWADTTVPHGQVILAALGGLAEFEHELVRVRIRDGRARAAKRGQRMGRPSSLTLHQRQEALRALAAGNGTQADLAKKYNVSQSTISRLRESPPAAEPSRRTLDTDTQRAAKAFLSRLQGRHVPLDALVYGSRARGDHRPDSDADIAVILKGRRGDRYETLRDLSDVAYDILLETGIHIQPLPIWDIEMRRPELFGNPALIETIKREGVRP